MKRGSEGCFGCGLGGGERGRATKVSFWVIDFEWFAKKSTKKIKKQLRGIGVVLISQSRSEKRRLKNEGSEKQKQLTSEVIQDDLSKTEVSELGCKS